MSRPEATDRAPIPGFDAEKLLSLARQARRHAYAPYSGFRVGAAVLAGRRIFRGANVENAAYPVGVCAERVAVANAVTAGVREIWAVAIASSSPLGTPPCGMCRQFLFEFNPEMIVVSEGTSGDTRTWRLEELLPEGFEPKHLTST
ncbi:MAG: cytidine deaminase [Actinomycetota bacterium]